jgi:hypothetical protein
MKTHITQQEEEEEEEEEKIPTLYHSLRDISHFFQVLHSKNNYPKPY